MSSAEKIPPVSGVVASEILKVPAAANEGVFVSVDDLRRNGWWKNKDDARVRVDAERFTLTDYSAGGQEILYGSLEEIAKKLQTEGFTFFPIEGEAAQEKGVQVPVREESAPKEVLPDADLEKRLEAARELDEKMDQGTKEAEAILERIDSILSQAHDLSQEHGFEAIRAVLDEIASQVTEKIETVNSLSSTDDIANENLVIDEAYITGKEQRWEMLQSLCGELDTLSEHAARTLQSLEKLSDQALAHDKEVPEIISGATGDAPDEAGSGSGETKKPNKRLKKGRGGGSDDGGDDTGTKRVSPEEKKAAKKRARLLQKQERQQAEGVPVPDKEVEAWREELDAFLRRPKGKEKVKMIEEIIQEEWNIFTGKISAVASENNAFISDGEMMRLWNRYGLEALEDMIAEHLDKTEGMEWQEGRAIFQAIVKNLEDSAKNEG